MNNFNKILIFFIVILTIPAFALNSSSYLIANTAIKYFDFEEAYSHYKFSKDDLSEFDLENKLLTSIHLNLLAEANKTSKQILKINIYNNEAWIVHLAFAKLNNKMGIFDKFKKNKNNAEVDFINFIFFDQNGNVKNNKNIALSIFELVQASMPDIVDKTRYSYILFYLSIANLLDPDFDEGYFYSAQIYQILEKYNKAEKLYKKISVNHDLFVDSQKYIAINKYKLGFYEAGERHLLKYINNFNNNNFFLAIADFYRFTKNYDDAINYYTKSIKSKQISSEQVWRIYYYRGICYERLSLWNLAEKDFLNSLEIKSDSPNVLNYLAYGWIERNQNIDKALNMLKKAYKSYPESYYILDSLAWAYFKKNNFQKAAELMEEVIVLAPGEAISLDHLGDIYFAMKRKREAIYFWKQALDLAEPEDLIEDELIKKLKQNQSG